MANTTPPTTPSQHSSTPASSSTPGGGTAPAAQPHGPYKSSHSKHLFVTATGGKRSDSPSRPPIPHCAGVFYQDTHNVWDNFQTAKGVDQPGEFPGLRTFLWYNGFNAPTADVDQLIRAMEPNYVPVQLGFEPGEWIVDHKAKGGGRVLGWNCAEMVKAYKAKDPHEKIYKATLRWAKFLAGAPTDILLRPMSEMNDEEGSYSLVKNAAADFAGAWCGLREIFDDAGATNVRFLFDVFEGEPHGLTRPELVTAALKQIPESYIDAYGVHPYSRKKNGDGSYVSFAQLTEGWFRAMEGVHPGKQKVIGEMGLSSYQSAKGERGDPLNPHLDLRLDTERAHWIAQAFASAKNQGLAMVTYFDDIHTTWGLAKTVLDGKGGRVPSPAHAELRKQLASF